MKSFGDYINWNFIQGSAAEVERQWSMENYTMDDNRNSMIPQLPKHYYSCASTKYSRGLS